MKLKRRPRTAFRLLAAAAFSLLLAAGSGSAQDDLGKAVQLRLDMFVVTEQNGQEHYTPSITARSGQVVEYRILAVNHATQELQPGTVIVTVPVPADTTYVPNSAVPRTEEVLVEFKSGDSDYMVPPVLVTDGAERTVADPVEYDGVRWTLLVPLEVGGERQFSFRVTVD